jgi:hypothetical protein
MRYTQGARGRSQQVPAYGGRAGFFLGKAWLRCHPGAPSSGRPERRRLPGIGAPRAKGILIFRLLSRFWIPVVVLAVAIVGGFAVHRVHGYFASQKRESYADSNLESAKPFNPKRIIYQVFGPAGSSADISYFDVNSDPQRVDGAKLPWTLDISTTKPAVMGNLVAQGDGDSIGCRITVDGEVKAERVTNEVNAYTFCVVKSA